MAIRYYAIIACTQNIRQLCTDNADFAKIDNEYRYLLRISFENYSLNSFTTPIKYLAFSKSTSGYTPCPKLQI